MIIQITAPGAYVCDDANGPEVGHKYRLEASEGGSSEQGRAFHALLQEYWKSGTSSYPAKSFEEFKNQIKKALGAGFESYLYIDMIEGMPILKEVTLFSDIPEHVRKDKDRANYIRGRLLSWSDYTKRQRTETIDRLIAEMIQAGVQSIKFNEILEGMQ